MNASMKFWVISAMCRHAAFIMPARHEEWALAMIAEAEYIDDPNAAIAFAAGSIWCSYVQRLKSFSFPDILRYAAALIAGVYGIANLYVFILFGANPSPAYITALSIEKWGEVTAALLPSHITSFLLNGLIFIGIATAFHLWRIRILLLFGALSLLINTGLLGITYGAPPASASLSTAILLEEVMALILLAFIGCIVRAFSKNKNEPDFLA